MENILNNEEGNELIISFINKGLPFGVSRIGIGEIHLLHKKINGINDSNIYTNIRAGGVREDSHNFFFEEYLKGITDADINVFWKGLNLDNQQNNIFNKYSPNSIKVMNRSVEPFYFKNPWSSYLNGKKVLVVNPFTETIKKQHKHLDKIWGGKNVMPSFDLLTLKSPFLTDESSPSWKDTLNDMKTNINSLDFDIALLGCSLYGLPLVSHIKKIGKSAIYIGGPLQLLFGIRGKRWDVHPEINPMFNEYWVRPDINEIPINYMGTDGDTYW